MKVLDPGHEYLLDSLDGECENRLIFVKRVGEKYPGNVGTHPGTTTQEVLLALIERTWHVYQQKPCSESQLVAYLLESDLYLLEVRAARRHGRILEASSTDVVFERGKCKQCGHIGCDGSCRSGHENQ